MGSDAGVAGALADIAAFDRTITVTLSNELVHLLSEQMYQSPIKAVEELVVNAYDAGATDCRLLVPLPPDSGEAVVVFDNGTGMDADGLQDLWHIGRSSKRQPGVDVRLGRKQIGKFGIGKLATYAIANLVTYLTKTPAGIFSVTMDFRRFAEDPTGGQPLDLDIRTVDPGLLLTETHLIRIGTNVGMAADHLVEAESWTFVVLEALKPKMGAIRRRDLNWVLSTAMPLQADFALQLNGDPVSSHKASFEVKVNFDVADLPQERLDGLEEKTRDGWRVEAGALVSTSFPSGVRGRVIVTRQSLYAGKSIDLVRSHGFFVKVRGRLVEESDPLFGIEPLSYEVFNRFRADLEADDLDAVVTAPREGFEASEIVAEFRALLVTVFYEARGRFDALKRAAAEEERRKREHERNYVDPTQLDDPIADVLGGATAEPGGADADDTWFYLHLSGDLSRMDLIARLYEARTSGYRYADIENGRAGRLVRFDPVESTFYINVDHPLVQAHDDPAARVLLEDVVTAEVMLEVYLREQGLRPSQVGEVLERRDHLLRSLAADHLSSVRAIADQLRAAADDEHDLEVNVVMAARAIGFVAKHISGAGRPDGVARYSEYPGGDRKITLEAKASAAVPSLTAIDFAGLAEHVTDEHAMGCMLVAPAYPGAKKADNAAAAKRAEDARISCWTVEQLASVVEATGARHVSAAQILTIVTTSFTPDQVRAAVDGLLGEPTWIRQDLYGAVIDALRALEGRLADRPRSVDLVASEVTRDPQFTAVSGEDILRALEAVAAASQGLMRVVGGVRVHVDGDYDELERRAVGLTGRAAKPRRPSTFRDDGGT